MDTMTIALGIVTLLLFQVNLSKRNNKKMGLLIPIVFLLLSFVLVFRLNGYVEIYGKIIRLFDRELIILKSLGILLFLNVPTVVFLTVHFRDKFDGDKGLKERNTSK